MTAALLLALAAVITLYGARKSGILRFPLRLVVLLGSAAIIAAIVTHWMRVSAA